MLHSPAGPSSLEKLAFCPGSLRVEAEIPGGQDEEFDEARDTGITCHQAMEHLVKGLPLPELDSKEFEMVEMAVKRLNEALAGDQIIPGHAKTKYGGILIVERTFENLPYSPDGFPQRGTLDLAIHYPGSHILMIDWKFGGGFVNHPKWNLQMKGYTLALWRDVERVPVNVAIVQPQAGDFSTNPWVFEPDEYEAMLAELKGIVDAALVPGASCHVGQGCKYCKGKKAYCQVRMQTLSAFAPLGFDWREGYMQLDSLGKARFLTAMRASINVAAEAISFAKEGIRSTGEVPMGWSAQPTGGKTGGIRLAPRPSQPSWPSDAPNGTKQPQRNLVKGLRI